MHTHSSSQLIMVLGGARSGKSNFAARLAIQSGHSVAFIATATTSDDDMLARIEHHRATRPPEWYTIEEPLNLPRAVHAAAAQADVLLLDCMTLWVSNWLLAHDTNDEALLISSHYYDGVLAEITALLTVLKNLPPQKTLIVITNEVGLGIVPTYSLGRVYRDVLGLVNQHLAAAADRVYLMIAGLGIDIKRLHEEATI